MTRRQLLGGGAAVAAALTCGAAHATDADVVAALEHTHGGRLGVHLSDPGGDVVLSHRADERFALCSTLKAVVTAQVLALVDADRLALDLPVQVPQRRGLVAHSPVTERHAGRTLTVEELCHATMTTSDNTAVNLLFELTGGPAGATTFARRVGDLETRLDRLEPEVNVVDLAHGDVRDTTTPAAMAGFVRAVALGEVLRPASRERYVGWLRANTTGGTRLRAHWPAEWNAGDKTGTGGDGPTNDVAVAWPPGRAPFVLAAYYDRAGHPMEENAAVLAELGRWVVDRWSR